MSDKHFDSVIDKVCKKLNLPHELKDEQRTILKSILKKENVMGLLPTGFGKSYLYGLAPVLMDELYPGNNHICLIVSPLRSLMMDQVSRFSKLGIKSVSILRKEEMSLEEEEGLRRGDYSLVFTSPEAIFLPPWHDMLKSWRSRVCTLALDEAHCLSSWGDDFRQSYLRMVELRIPLTNTPLLILTATATQKMVNDILEKLSLTSGEVTFVAVVPDRPNIYLELQRVTNSKEDGIGWIAEEIKELGDSSPKTIVYARSVNTVASIYATFRKLLGEQAWTGAKSKDNLRVEMFHGSTDSATQAHILSRFKGSQSLKVVVATIAIGLGIDVEDIDRIVHWGPSKTILSYWQECGRCARDGRNGRAVLYLPPGGLTKGQVSEEMIQFVHEVESTKSCIRRALLKKLFVEGMDKNYIESLPGGDACCTFCSM